MDDYYVFFFLQSGRYDRPDAAEMTGKGCSTTASVATVRAPFRTGPCQRRRRGRHRRAGLLDPPRRRPHAGPCTRPPAASAGVDFLAWHIGSSRTSTGKGLGCLHGGTAARGRALNPPCSSFPGRRALRSSEMAAGGRREPLTPMAVLHTLMAYRLKAGEPRAPPGGGTRCACEPTRPSESRGV